MRLVPGFCYHCLLLLPAVLLLREEKEENPGDDSRSAGRLVKSRPHMDCITIYYAINCSVPVWVSQVWVIFTILLNKQGWGTFF